jgi:hypothetical protein
MCGAENFQIAESWIPAVHVETSQVSILSGTIGVPSLLHDEFVSSQVGTTLASATAQRVAIFACDFLGAALHRTPLANLAMDGSLACTGYDILFSGTALSRSGPATRDVLLDLVSLGGWLPSSLVTGLPLSRDLI